MKYLSWAAGALLCNACLGQTLRPALTATAIVGAKIEVRPGKIIENGTVVMQDGLIIDVGEHVTVPPGAQVLDGKGLFVYAGFIDGGSQKGLKKPDGPRLLSQPDISQDAVTQMRWGTPQVRPDLSAAAMYQPDDDAWKGYREAGFTTAALLPNGGIMSGTGCLVNVDGGPRRASVVQSPIGLSMQLAAHYSGTGDYPGTILGAYSVTRQTFLDARWYRSLKEFFNAGTGKRPPNDPTLESVLPVLAGDIPAIIEVDDYPQVDRVLDLASEFGTHPVIFGGLKAFKASAKLKTFKAPVIAALNWPKEPIPEKEEAKKEEPKKEEPKKPDAKTPVAPPAKPAEATPPKEDKKEEEGEPQEVKAERERLWLETATNVWVLTKAGIPVAFSTRGVKDYDTFFANLRRLVKLGLSREDALAGLTLNGAKIYGVERQLGAIEPGKIANLTVLSADFLDPKAKAKFVYIDGRKFEVGKAPFNFINVPQGSQEEKE